MKLKRLWRLLTHKPELNPPWLEAQGDAPPAVTVALACQACGRLFSQPVQRLYVDLAVSRQATPHSQTVLPGEITIPQAISCPACQAVDQYQVEDTLLSQLVGPLLWAKLRGNDPRSPIQFRHLPAPAAQNGPKQAQTRSRRC